MGRLVAPSLPQHQRCQTAAGPGVVRRLLKAGGVELLGAGAAAGPVMTAAGVVEQGRVARLQGDGRLEALCRLVVGALPIKVQAVLVVVAHALLGRRRAAG